MPYRAMGERRRPFDFMSPLYGGTCSHVEANEKTRHGNEWSGSSTSGSRGRVLSIPGLANVLTSDTQGGSPVPKSGSLGSVRGASSNVCPYRENPRHDDSHMHPPGIMRLTLPGTLDRGLGCLRTPRGCRCDLHLSLRYRRASRSAHRRRS